MLLSFVLCCGAAARGATTEPSAPAGSPPPVEFDIRTTNLTDAQAQALEERIKVNPDNAHLRAQLLGYYFVREYKQPDTVEARRAHVLWMIHNRPADRFTGSPFCSIDPVIDPDGYVAAEELWKQQAEQLPPSAAVLGNAAEFLRLHDPTAAADLLKRAEAVDPKNPQWPSDLASLHSRPMPSTKPAGQTDLAQLALAEFEKAFALSVSPEDRFYNLTPLPKAAFAAGDNAKATNYAIQLLVQARSFKGDWNYGNAVHTANLILGRVALASGDIDTAKARLLEAGKTPGSPQLDSFGPNMELARDLLQKRERDVVLQYFSLCAKFWTMGTDKLDLWTRTVKAGEIPDFGANLDY
ncbi:MAG: RNA polymerase subunit sigma-24 [Tepidisphaeraceae bacterium]